MKTRYKWVSAFKENGFLLTDIENDIMTIIDDSHWHGATCHYIGEKINVSAWCIAELPKTFVPYCDPVDLLKEML